MEGKFRLRAHKKQLKGSNRSKSIRQRMAQVAKRFMPFSYGDDGLITMAIAKRFERVADGAEEFLKFVEHSSHHKNFRIFPSLIRSLLDGKPMAVSLRSGSGTAVVLLQPWWIEEHDDGNAKKACLWVSYEHDQALEKNFKMMLVFHLSDFVDIPRIVMNTVDLLPPQFCNACASMKQVLSKIALCGRNSTASSLYIRFTRRIQNSHRYGFEPSSRHNKWSSDRTQLPDPILMACAHCYILPVENSTYHPFELVWHTSSNYIPKMLSEQHEMAEPQTVAEGLPKVINGFYYGEGTFDCGRQWWCPQSSTRLSMTPVLSSPTTLQKWCAKQKLEDKAQQS
ncbi:hypothetical protein QOZ80_9AG0687960 [Eleusine coracana subsp. coracana]|nr:hypothetical protein QOZ80_9AG0687960 [Eleusine coracana subsp. coracana]